MWEFAVGLFMIEIWKKSLLLTSLYGLVETAAIVLFGVRLGEWVDRFPRLRVIQASLALQNLCVFSATLAILLLLIRPYHKDGRGLIVFICLVAVVNIFGGISALASLATKISLERDWVIILAADQPSGQLTKMNSTMRRLDLACTLLAAVFVGFIMSAMSVVASAIGMATWNITCVGIEYWLLLSVYNGTPRLHEEKASYHLVSEMDIQKLVAQNSDVLFKEDKAPCKQSPCPNNLNSFQLSLALLNNHGTFLWHKVRTLSVFDGWKVYLRQESMLAGIAFSLLSVSVLRCYFLKS
ncbi:hypothetical protein KP509_19G019300 [Ceratopteris richardii]|uniref:Solute carrier family 40 member n=1 Tax=Ceratopteris richardii TaxID=49495 RepID=A0A8T2SLK0_CERRI|nr:hypothetical protein KP509_19G019300 [Ceratopteris richardii]